MTLSASALTVMVQQWLRMEPSEVSAVCSGAVIDDDFVDRLEAGLPRLRTLEATHGGLRARKFIDAELGMVAEVLARSSYSTALGRRLYSQRNSAAGPAGRVSTQDCTGRPTPTGSLRCARRGRPVTTRSAPTFSSR
jgi:hypothetical protein